MRKINLDELNYDLEIDRISSEIKKKKARRVLIQLPDGLKPYAAQIVDAIQEKLKAKNKPEIMIYFGTCFGACDLPIEEAKIANIDLIVQFGHSPWIYKS